MFNRKKSRPEQGLPQFSDVSGGFGGGRNTRSSSAVGPRTEPKTSKTPLRYLKYLFAFRFLLILNIILLLSLIC